MRLSTPTVPLEPQQFVAGACFVVDFATSTRLELDNFKSMERWGLAHDVMQTLRELTASGWDERTVVASFLEAIAGTSAAAAAIRSLLRGLRKHARRIGVDPRLVSYLAQAMNQITPQCWNWAPDCAPAPTMQRPAQ